MERVVIKTDRGVERTNITVSPHAKITVSPTANLVINGKRVENPEQCNHQ